MKNKLDYVFTLGRPLSPIYGMAMKIREKLYLSQVLKSHQLQVPVISVGNLVLGGTGKTPTVQHVAGLLSKIGQKPAIISRGYGGVKKDKINVVSNGQEILLSPRDAGDEPYMLAKLLPDIPVITGTKRIHPCNYAIEHLGANVLILDDGFQHMAVTRNINLVLFDATELAGNSRIFPGGPLREPVSALHRCDAFLITGVTPANRDRAESFALLLQQKLPEKPLFYSSHGNIQIVDSNGNPLDNSKKHNLFGFCGIANPSRFYRSIENINCQLAGMHTFKDHTSYNQKTIEHLIRSAMAKNSNGFLTTAKDSVKLEHFDMKLPVYILKINIEIEPSFDDFLCSKLK